MSDQHAAPTDEFARSAKGASGALPEANTVIVATPDLAGRLVGKRLTARSFAQSPRTRTCDLVYAWGLGYEVLDGFASIGWEHGYGDVVNTPDPESARRLAWWPDTALVMADVSRDDGQPVPFAPRTVLRTQVERFKELGYEPLTASELEFTVFAEDDDSMRRKGYGDLDLHRNDLRPELVETTDADEPLLREIRDAMEASGVLIESVKAEFSASQFEIALAPATPLETADRHAVYKLGVRELCRRRGLAATFMARWDDEHAGQSSHLHVSLRDADGSNVFADGGELMQHFIAGVRSYAADVFLLWAPYPNSYKRFLEHSFVPTSLSWGADNRTVALRICGNGSSRHLENRIPGADVNPYLALAGLLAAGRAGIVEKLPADNGIGRGDAYAADGQPPLPRTLDEALTAFRHSEFTAEVFGKDVVEHIAAFAAAEQDAARRAVTDFERRRLFHI